MIHLIQEKNAKKYKYACEEKWYGITAIGGRWTIDPNKVTCEKCKQAQKAK